MKVAVYQFAPEFGEIEKNLEMIEQAIDHKSADLIVLPELCTTGYQFIAMEEVNALCETIPDGPTIKRLEKLARDKETFIIGGYEK